MSGRTEVAVVAVVLAIGAAGGIYRSETRGPELPPAPIYTAPTESGEPSDPTNSTAPTPVPSTEPTPIEGKYLPARWTSEVAPLVADDPAEKDCLNQAAARQARALALGIVVEPLRCERPFFVISTATASFPEPESGRATDLEPTRVAQAVRDEVNDYIAYVGVGAFSYDDTVYLVVIGALS